MLPFGLLIERFRLQLLQLGGQLRIGTDHRRSRRSHLPRRRELCRELGSRLLLLSHKPLKPPDLLASIQKIRLSSSTCSPKLLGFLALPLVHGLQLVKLRHRSVIDTYLVLDSSLRGGELILSFHFSLLKQPFECRSPHSLFFTQLFRLRLGLGSG